MTGFAKAGAGVTAIAAASAAAAMRRFQVLVRLSATRFEQPPPHEGFHVLNVLHSDLQNVPHSVVYILLGANGQNNPTTTKYVLF